MSNPFMVSVEVQVTSINKKQSPDFAKIGSITLMLTGLVPYVGEEENRGKNLTNTISGMTHAKLVREVSQYVSCEIDKIDNYWEGATDQVQACISAKQLATQYFRTADYEFDILNIRDLNTIEEAEEAVKRNINLEIRLAAVARRAVACLRTEIHKAADTSLTVRQKRTAIEQSLQKNEPEDVRLVTLEVEAIGLKKPTRFELVLNSFNEFKVLPSDEGKKYLLGQILSERLSAMTNVWAARVAEGGMSYNARCTYMQQIVDLRDLVNNLCSDSAKISIVCMNTLPWLSREVSHANFASFIDQLRTIVFRKNRNILSEMFDEWQIYKGTRHPDGVME